jgi:hypothetical protein
MDQIWPEIIVVYENEYRRIRIRRNVRLSWWPVWRWLSFGMLSWVLWQKLSNVLEVLTTSTIVEVSISETLKRDYMAQHLRRHLSSNTNLLHAFKRDIWADAFWLSPADIYCVHFTADKTLYFRDDDEFLIRFLRPTKFYPESALQLVSKCL